MSRAPRFRRLAVLGALGVVVSCVDPAGGGAMPVDSAVDDSAPPRIDAGDTDTSIDAANDVSIDAVLEADSAMLPTATIEPLGITASVYDMDAAADGTVHVLWRQGSLHCGRLGIGKVVEVQDIPDSFLVNTRFARPRLAVRADGTSVHATWVDAIPGVTLLHASREGGGVWKTETVWKQTTPGEYLAVPSIVADGAGVVHVIAQRWHDGVVESPIVYFRKPAGGVWSPAAVLHSEIGKQWRDTDMITDAKGNVHATWKSGARPGKYRFAPSGGDLAASTTVDIAQPAGVTTVSFGDLFVTKKGDVHHAFMTYPSEDIWYEVRRDGPGAFGEASRVEHVQSDETTGYENPWSTMAVDSHGRVYVSWAENRGASRIAYVILAVSGPSGWTTRVVSSTADIDMQGRPVMAVSGDDVHLLWRGDGGALMHGTFRYPPL